jgi:N-acetylglucosamine-6-phosphate deacetylase
VQRALVNTRVFDGETIRDGLSVIVQDSRILAVRPVGELGADIECEDLGGALLAPGFIDVQVNGGGGVLFNDAPTSETIRTIGAAHRHFGTTGFLPTLITDSRERMCGAIDAVAQAQHERVPGVLGIHLEGPYLNDARRGVHDPVRIREWESDAIEVLAALPHGTTLVTLAPEKVPAGTIEQLVARGLKVAAGHTAATYADIQAALAEGLTGFTHLFNAMTPLNSREPGVVGAALDNTASWCGLIVDGHHVHPATLRVAIAAKQRGGMLLVTDAMPPVGSDQSAFALRGEAIKVENQRCTNAEGVLAGSVLDMATAVRNTVALLGLPLDEALRMASRYPAEFLGLQQRYGSIAPGYDADLVLLDDNLQVLKTWIAGQAEARSVT